MSWLREANAEPIPGYRLIEPLGSGGFGEVWKCEAPGGLNKAIKFVFGSLNSVDVDGIRAEQEFKALQRIKEVRHPFVCSVERIDFVDGELVIVMELAERTLHDMYQECQASGLLGIPGDDLLRYLRDAAEALDFMNEKHNLQHLDVKPRNLFLIGDRIKVADFGLVKHLERQSSGILGSVTPMYASPETFVGKLSPHSDQYSLAIVYQEMLTGHRPFQAKNIRQMAQMHLQGDPDLRSLPAAERPIIGRALAKDPVRRYANCMAFVAALYKARTNSRRLDRTPLGKERPQSKPMSATMEDVFLGDFEEASNGLELDESSAVDLTATPVTSPVPVMPAEEGEVEVEVGDLGVTVMQPDHGALRPTLIVGLGSFGRKAILELRCRFLDRFGDLSKLSLLRFLYLDIDPEAGQAALRGAPEVALTRNDFYPLALQQVTNYRRRSLEQLTEWLPREKLYSLPRSLQTQGSRALGRLAFAENQQRLLGRLKRDIQDITNPDHIYQSVTHTGLALSSNTPRICVIAAAGGGSSGLLPDLGYAVRRLLTTLRHPDAVVNLFLLGGAPNDPATPKTELANVYATLTELNHYSDPTIPFVAQYGPDAQRLVDQGPPFHSVYFLPLAHRSPDALDETVAHLGSYLFHELTTPLGVRLDDQRLALRSTDAAAVTTLEIPLRSFGTYAVWFPRGLLLHLAARQACVRLIEGWTESDAASLPAEVHGVLASLVERYTANAELAPSFLTGRIEKLAQTGGIEGTGGPGEALARLLAKLEDQLNQPMARDNPANWGKQALGRIKDWVGSSGDGAQELNEWRKTRLARLLMTAAQTIAEEWQQNLSADVFTLMQYPGARVAGAELAFTQLQRLLEASAQTLLGPLQQKRAIATKSWNQLESVLAECTTGGRFRFFGGRSRSRQLRAFMDQLARFTRDRLDEELTAAARHCLLNLAARLADRNRDLGLCRQRLRGLQELLVRVHDAADADLTTPASTRDLQLGSSPVPSADAFWDTIRQSATARVVLPDGTNDLETAARSFLENLHFDHWLLLDRELYEQVLEPQGGFTGACLSGDLTRVLAAPLLETAAKFLGQHLPMMDVAQIVKGEANGTTAEELTGQTRDYLERAAPLLPALAASKETSYLLVPASAAGKALGEALEESFPNLLQVRVPGQSDLMFLREQGSLDAADLAPILKMCHPAYEALAHAPSTSPHARFDISDWLPLDP